jgi:hypothetical protein
MINVALFIKRLTLSSETENKRLTPFMKYAQNSLSFWAFQHVEDLDSDIRFYDMLCS